MKLMYFNSFILFLQSDSAQFYFLELDERSGDHVYALTGEFKCHFL